MNSRISLFEPVMSGLWRAGGKNHDRYGSVGVQHVPQLSVVNTRELNKSVFTQMRNMLYK